MLLRVEHIIPAKGDLRADFTCKRVVRAAISAVIAAGLVTPVLAQESAVPDLEDLQELSVDGFSINVDHHPVNISDELEFDFVGLSPALEGAVIDLPDESAGSRLFNLDFANTACLTGDVGCLTQTETLDVRYNTSFAASLDKGLDIELVPRASVSFDDESSSALVGALVRIGDDLKDTSDFKNNTWYMFAGADAEAVTYSPNSVRRLTNGEFYLQDRIIVGDAQAGVGYRMGDADVSLGYFRREVASFGREVDSGGVSYTEDAAALSFTWRR